MEFAFTFQLWLADAALRSLVLAIAALALICLLRIRSAASRHALWTIVTIAMLLTPVLSPILPTIPLRILPAAPSANLPSAAEPAPRERPPFVTRPTNSSPTLLLQRRSTSAPFPWKPLVAALYAVGLLVSLGFLLAGYRFTRRLVSSAVPIQLPATTAVYQSARITVPVAVGFRYPAILLPATWRDWPAEKLAAVMTHEQLHIRRADWPIALLAALNRCVFWFHPLSWWLESHLATLAEHACDDAALLELPGSRESYAQVLLDMASAVNAARGRIVSDAIAMAKTAKVRTRIERILDETRQLSGTLTRSRWMGLLACSLPVVYLAVGMQLAQRSSTAQSPVNRVNSVADPATLRPDLSTGTVAHRSVAALKREVPRPIAMQAARAVVEEPAPQVAAQPTPDNSPSWRIPAFQLHHGKPERSARITLTVAAGGRVSDLYVSRSVGIGTDEKAAEVAREALFGPVPRAAIPFARRGTVDVPFRLVARSRRHKLGFAQPVTQPAFLPIPTRGWVVPAPNDETPWAKFLGTVTLSVTANASGTMQSVQIRRALGPAFDENAITAIMQWDFQPIYSIDRTTLFDAAIEVDFRLI